jgi:hypothetical protein
MHCASCYGGFFRRWKYIMRGTVFVIFYYCSFVRNLIIILVVVVVVVVVVVIIIIIINIIIIRVSCNNSACSCLRWFSQRVSYRSLVKQFSQAKPSTIFDVQTKFHTQYVLCYNQPVSLMYILLNKLRIPSMWNDSLIIFKSELGD